MTRIARAGIAVVVLALGLSACSSGETPETPETTPPAATETAAPEPTEAEPTETEPAGDTRVVIGQDGEEIVLPAEVERVGASIGAFAHTSAMLGGDEQLVATIANLSDLYKEVWPAVNPGGHDTSNVEDVIASGAQVIYGPNITDEQAAQYEAAGITVVIIDNFSNPEEMKSVITLIGDILGNDAPERAVAYNNYYDGVLATVSERTAAIPEAERTRVLTLRYDGNGYTTVGGSDISVAYAEAAGGVVVSRDVEAGSTADVGAEQIIEWAPT